jgi:Domain of unknown function (DUF1707)
VTAANHYRYDSAGSPRDRSLRAGDKERDAVSEILRGAHVEGRLNDDEFEARIERCLTARTYADLDGLIADFPREEAGSRPAGRPRGWRPWPVPFVFLPLAVVAAVAVGGHVAWFAIPLVFVVVRTFAWGTWAGGPARGPWARSPGRMTRGGSAFYRDRRPLRAMGAPEDRYPR